MQYSLILSTQAELAIDDAYKWYEEQKEGLGDVFISAVDIAFSTISTNPQFFSFRKKNVRGCHLRKFPYIVFYIAEKNEIRVISILHTSRKPLI